MSAVVNAGEKLLLRYPEAAARLSVSRTTIYQLIAQGHLPVVKIGRSRRIPADALADLVAQSSELKGEAVHG